MAKNKADSKKKAAKKPRWVAVSGGFDPIHIGHTRMFNEAKKLGDKLVVILNNDNWLCTKKGYAFMPENERKEVIEGLRAVDRVVLTCHTPNDPDRSVSRELAKLKPTIFANGGDRKNSNDIPEGAVCKKHGIRMVFSVGKGGKVQSSSWLTANVKKQGNVDPKADKKVAV
ncbi:adenylyltransferase/cytidyltransferase family protein [Candidatus Kaiserbacteria bacterium]|nr:adenylyltransferase/cytidyltransferase family protein [Candidatus Kaiserbacteria bacterium]